MDTEGFFVSLTLAEAAFGSIYQAACSCHFKADEDIINSKPKKVIWKVHPDQFHK